MKQPTENPVKTQSNINDRVDDNAPLSEDEVSKVSAGATTGATCIFGKLPPYKERA